MKFHHQGTKGKAEAMPVQGTVKVDQVKRDPSPTALRSPLSPRERAVIFYPSPGGERGPQGGG